MAGLDALVTQGAGPDTMNTLIHLSRKGAMQENKVLRFFYFLLSLFFIVESAAFAQRVGYSKDEFLRRRNALMDKVGGGMIVLFGESMPQPVAHFRQDNDFYYFSGIEDKNAVLLMAPKTKATYLFLPVRSEETAGEPNLLEEEKAKKEWGFMDILPLSRFDELAGRNSRWFGLTFYLRFWPPDAVDNSPWEVLTLFARRNEFHYNDQIPLENYRVAKLKERYPALEFKDIGPFIDAMRLIKSAEEIEVLRRNGRISAEAVKQAMLGTAPGAYEYEIEAEAMHVVLKNGARGAAYPPIVASGPNSCSGEHYTQNSRRVEAGDLVLMDFGADLDYLCMDITRTWPASGKFTPEQREVYTIVLEVQKACIEAYRPGVTAKDVQKHVAEVMEKKGLDSRGLVDELRFGFGHGVGMTVHDVGVAGIPLREGIVFAIEPGLYYPEKGFGIRIEDTVLITKDGCEVLTKDVPKEIDDIEKLLAKRATTRR